MGIGLTIKQMSNREKYFVGFAVVIIVGVVLYQFVYAPFVDGKRSKVNQIATKRGQLEEMVAMQGEFRALREKTQSVQRMAGDKDKGFTLFSFLEKLAGNTGVKDKISYMKPSTSVQKETQVALSLVEMKLQGVDLKKLMEFLYQVETSPNGVFVRGVSLTKTGKDKKLLTAILQFETVKQES
jgi:general secretion pathway protein M